MSKAELAAMYLDHLRQEGYTPETDGEGDIHFKQEGFLFYIIIDDKDPAYFHLVLPGIWSLESSQERARALEVCALVASATKVVKLFPVRDSIWVTAELFLAQPEDFKAVLRRCLRLLPAAAHDFAAKMRAA